MLNLKLTDADSLTTEEIDFIRLKIKNNLKNYSDKVLRLPQKGLDIAFISKNCKLVFVKKDDACWDHQQSAMHRFFNRESPKSESGYFSSIFLSNSGSGLFKISEIADEVFSMNDPISRGKEDNAFDVYEKEVPFMENLKYTLKLYKNTKIIHSIMPSGDNAALISKFYQDLPGTLALTFFCMEWAFI